MGLNFHVAYKYEKYTEIIVGIRIHHTTFSTSTLRQNFHVDLAIKLGFTSLFTLTIFDQNLYLAFSIFVHII